MFLATRAAAKFKINTQQHVEYINYKLEDQGQWINR